MQQDMLNLLSCLFKYGELHDVARTINEGLGKLSLSDDEFDSTVPPFTLILAWQAPSRLRLGLECFHSCWQEFKLSPRLFDRSYIPYLYVSGQSTHRH